MRQLRRACNIIKECLKNQAVSLSPLHSLYVGLRLSFYLDLNENSKKLFNNLFNISFVTNGIELLYLDKQFYRLTKEFDKNDEYLIWQDFPIRKANFNSLNLESVLYSNNIVITPNIRTIICDLLRVLLYDGSRPILLEGPTSVGKTSIIIHLAELIGQKVVRLNNHRDTDVDEYIGSYVPDKSGKIRFQEGVLLQCMREGSWLLLDELNLARSEILEALNRVLDDNQELFVPELDVMLKPSPGFRIFATQNPNSYSGRSTLSVAFRNRFIVVNFESHDEIDLKSILISKAKIPESRAQVMIKIMQKLETLRSADKIFEGKEGLITIRDLLKWGSRRDENASIKQLANVGYFLLGERVRDFQQKQLIRNIISEESGIKFTSDTELYQSEFNHFVSKFPNFGRTIDKFEIKMSTQFMRLFCLVNNAFSNKEAALLIGQPGCGKTTLAQMLADIYEVPFYSINCHKHTEVSDFLGGWKPCRNKTIIIEEVKSILETVGVILSPEQIEQMTKESIESILVQLKHIDSDKLTKIQGLLNKLASEFEWVDGNLIEAVKNGGVYLIDEISLANDSVLERLNSLLESTRELSLQQSDQKFLTLKAHPRFVIIATMNPSGDFGKRELSPALRNRFTEIWVTSILDSENYSPEGTFELKQFLFEFSESINIKHIKNHQSYSSSKLRFHEFVFDLFSLVNSKYQHTVKPINLRDLTTLCFLFSKNFDSTEMNSLKLSSAVIFESILSQIRDEEIATLLQADFCNLNFKHFEIKEIEMPVQHFSFEIRQNSVVFGFIEIQKNTKPIEIDNELIELTKCYQFNDVQVKQNLFKLLFGLQSGKPILIEGNPGTGKTSLIEVVACLTRNQIYRVNLSEQTDLIDLLGSYIPDKINLGFFTWKDGLLLKALKEGAWIIFDELNLANQTILEGLNSILDHRGEVFLPDLGQTVAKKEGFRFFGTQNSMAKSKNRKGLPSSFLNRFFKIYTKDFELSTLKNIIDKLIFTRTGDQNAFSNIMNQLYSQLEQSEEMNIRFFIKVISFLCEFPQVSDSFMLKVIDEFFIKGQFGDNEHSMFLDNMLDFATTEQNGFICYDKMKQNQCIAVKSKNSIQSLKTFPLKQFKHLVFALQFSIKLSFPLLFLCKSNFQISISLSCLENLAKTHQMNLKTLALYKSADISDLIGNYEQCNWEVIAKDLAKSLNPFGYNISVNCTKTDLINQFKVVIDDLQCKNIENQLKGKIEKTICLIEHEKSVFKWSSSPIIKAIVQGKWVVLLNCEQANFAVLEKLNGFLEKSEFILNECYDENGEIQRIKKHENFRIFFVFDCETKNSEVPKGLQNRCLSINMNHYMNKQINDRETRIKQFYDVLRSIKSYQFFNSSQIRTYFEEDYACRQNVLNLCELGQDLQANKALISNQKFAEMEKNHLKPETELSYDGLLIKKITNHLREFCQNEMMAVSNEQLFDTPSLIRNSQELLLKRDPNRNWSEQISKSQNPFYVFKFLSLCENEETIETESIISYINFSDFGKLFSFFKKVQDDYLSVAKSETINSLTRISDNEKLLRLLLTRNDNAKARLFVTQKEHNPIYKLLCNEVLKAKEHFVAFLHPNVKHNFQQMIKAVFNSIEIKTDNQLQLDLFGRPKTTDKKLESGNQIATVYCQSVDQLFGESLEFFKNNVISIFDEFEDSHLTLISLSDENQKTIVSYLMNREKLLMTDFEKSDEIIVTNFGNICEIRSQFQEFISLNEFVRRNDQSDVFKFLIHPINLKFKAHLTNLLTKRKSFSKIGFTLFELQIVRSFWKSLRATTKLNIGGHFANTNIEYFQELSEHIGGLKKENKNGLYSNVTKETFLCSVKSLLQMETSVLQAEQLNFVSTIEHYEVFLQLNEDRQLITSFLKSLIFVLERNLKNQILVEATSNEQNEDRMLIGERLFELVFHRLMNINRFSNSRIIDKLHNISKRALFEKSESLKNEIVDFLFEVCESSEFLFSEIVTPKLMDELNGLMISMKLGTGLKISDFASNDILLDSATTIKMKLFESQYSSSKVSEMKGTLKNVAQRFFAKIRNSIDQLNQAYKTQIKSTGLSEASKHIKLQEHFDKMAKYEYDKKTVEENSKAKEEDFRTTFNMMDWKDEKNEDKNIRENLNRITLKFNQNFEYLWEHLLPCLAIDLRLNLTFKSSLSDYVLRLKESYLNLTNEQSDLSVLNRIIDGFTCFSKQPTANFLETIDVLVNKKDSCLKNLVSQFIIMKQKRLKCFNFYDESYDLSFAEKMMEKLNALIVKIHGFHKDVLFTDLSSLNALIKACKTVSEMKANSSLANMCTGVEILQRNLDEFNCCLPNEIKLSKEREDFKQILLEMRRLEKHKWKDFIQLKRHELMNQDIVDFSNQTNALASVNLLGQIKIIENALSESNYANFAQRIVLLLWEVSNLSSATNQAILVNLLEFYACYSDDISEKMQALEPEIEEPMKNSMKLMNWHFEDILNIKINVEKLYRGIHKTIKKQKELLEKDLKTDVFIPLRSSILFQSINEAHANFSKVVLKQTETEKYVVTKVRFLELMNTKQDFSTHFTEKDLSFFKLISAAKLTKLFGIASQKRKPKFNRNLMFKNEISQFMKNYLERMNDLKDEKKQSFIQRAVIDFMSDLKSFGLKSRITYQSHQVYLRIFQEYQVVKLTDRPSPIRNSPLNDDLNDKTKKMNLRFSRIVDCLKNINENQNHNDDLTPENREKVISFMFGLYFILSEHERQFIKISDVIEEISVKEKQRKTKIDELVSKVCFLIDCNIELCKTECNLSASEIKLLSLTKSYLTTNKINEAYNLLNKDDKNVHLKNNMETKHNSPATSSNSKVVRVIAQEIVNIVNVINETNTSKLSESLIKLVQQKHLLNLKISTLKKEFETNKTDDYFKLQLSIFAGRLSSVCRLCSFLGFVCLWGDYRIRFRYFYSAFYHLFQNLADFDSFLELRVVLRLGFLKNHRF